MEARAPERRDIVRHAVPEKAALQNFQRDSLAAVARDVLVHNGVQTLSQFGICHRDPNLTVDILSQRRLLFAQLQAFGAVAGIFLLAGDDTAALA